MKVFLWTVGIIISVYMAFFMFPKFMIALVVIGVLVLMVASASYDVSNDVCSNVSSEAAARHKAEGVALQREADIAKAKSESEELDSQMLQKMLAEAESESVRLQQECLAIEIKNRQKKLSGITTLLSEFDKVYFDTNMFMGDDDSVESQKIMDELFRTLIKLGQSICVISDVNDELYNNRESDNFAKAKKARAGIRRMKWMGDNIVFTNYSRTRNKSAYADPSLERLFRNRDEKFAMVSLDSELLSKARSCQQHYGNTEKSKVIYGQLLVDIIS